jgi:hypothetical protein
MIFRQARLGSKDFRGGAWQKEFVVSRLVGRSGAKFALAMPVFRCQMKAAQGRGLRTYRGFSETAS